MRRRAPLLVTALLCTLAAAPLRAAEKIVVRAAAHDGFGRIVFDWQKPVAYDAHIDGSDLVIHFARPFSVSLATLTDRLDAYIASAALSADGMSVIAKLKRPVDIKAFLVNGLTVAVDLTARGAAPPPGAAKAAEAQPIAVRAASHEGFGRIVFAWPKPVTYTATIEGGDLVIRFARPFTAKLDAISDRLDAYVSSAALGADGRSVVAKLKQPVAIKTFVDDDLAIAVDLTARGGISPPPAAALVGLAPAAGEPPAAAKSAPEAKPILVPLRIGRPKGAEQVALVWPFHVDYSFAVADGIVRLTFRQRATIDNAGLAAALPGFAPRLEDKDGSTTLLLTVPKGMHVGHFRSGNEVVLEVTGTALAATSASPSTTKPVAPAPDAKAAVKPPTALAPRPAGAAAPPTPPQSLPPAAAAAPPASAADVSNPPGAPDRAVPPASLVVHYAIENDHASLRFDWPMATGAAIFRRGMKLWVVFGAPTKLDLSEPVAKGQAMLRGIEQLAVKNVTVLRFVPGDGINPSARRAGNSWFIDLKVQPALSEAPIDVDVRPANQPPAVRFRVRQASRGVRLRDPDLRDTLLVVPVAELGRGINLARDFIDFRLLPSIEGIVMRANSDDLTLHIDDESVEVTRPSGLSLSSERDRLLGPAPTNLHRIFNFAAWNGPKDQNFVQRRSILDRAVATAVPSARSEARLNLAHFYFAHLFDAETLSVLGAIAQDDPTFAADTRVRSLKGAACLLAGQDDCAAQEFARSELAGEAEASLWRGALAADKGDWDGAARSFIEGVALLPDYPQPLRNRFALQAAEAMLGSDRADAAVPLIDLVMKDPQSIGDTGMGLYLQGLRAQQAGLVDKALDLWDKAAAMGDRRSRARALNAHALALYDSGKANRAETIKALDALRFSWRGDAFEFNLLRRLGEMEIADGDPSNGIEVLNEAATNFPDYPPSKDITKEIADTFADLYLGTSADDLPPLKALVLYDQFHDVEPAGPRRDAIVRKLVDRLVAVDLLDRAAALLEDQVKTRLAGRDKARAATQLALLRLMDRKPDAAVAALDIEVDHDLPVELVHQRQELRARALLDLKRGDDALKTLASDDSRDAERLRADIYWRAQNWKEAAKSFQRLAGDAPPGAKLDPEMSRLVLNWAAALTLDGDQQGLAKLRAAYAAAMAATPQADAFHIIASEDSAGSGTDPREAASRVAQLGELQDFMAAYKARLATEKLSAIN